MQDQHNRPDSWGQDVEYTACWYCGSIATTIDHVPPKCVRPRLTALGLHQTVHDVPACRECNCALGTQHPFSIDARKRWIKEWLRRRYRRLLATPEWSEWELDEMGASFRNRITSTLERKRVTELRLKF